MRILAILFLMFCLVQVYGQGGKIKPGREKAEPEFATAGEQEAYWTKQLFKNQYKRKVHKRFGGQITRVDEFTFKYDSVTIRVFTTDSSLLSIFENGLLFTWRMDQTISNIEELTSLNPNEHVRRFGCWVTLRGFANPITFFFELTNKRATRATSMKEFIEGSKLTFLKKGWVTI